MAEGFNEFLVKQRPTAKTFGFIVLIASGGMFLTILPIVLTELLGRNFLQFTILTLAGSVWGGKILLKRLSVEFEYSVHATEMVVDRILGQSVRKRVTVVDCMAFEILAVMKEQYLRDYKNVAKVIDVSSSPKSHDRWFAVYNAKDGIRTMLIFEPNQRIIDAFKTYISGKVKE